MTFDISATLLKMVLTSAVFWELYQKKLKLVWWNGGLFIISRQLLIFRSGQV